MTHKELKESQTLFLHYFCLPVCLPLCLSLCLSVGLSVWMSTFMSPSQCVTLLETAESVWRHVKYSLVAKRSRVHRPDVTHCSEGTSSLTLHSSTFTYSNPGQFTEICEYLQSGQWKQSPSQPLSVNISVTLLGSISPAQHAPADKLGWIKGSAQILLLHSYMFMCVCVCVCV